MLVHYKCPSCGSDMSFDADTGKLACQSCGRQDNIQDFDDIYITKQFSEDETRQYECENCGAEVLTTQDTTATSCSFCGAGVVLADRLSGSLAPAKIIPFTISKKEAQRAFRKWCKNGRFTPRGFMTANRIKNITGIYVPFWIYDLHSDVKVRATGTKVRTYKRGDYLYTETRYYDVFREVELMYKKVPVDASEKMDDELMDKLEPFHYHALTEFKMPYLTGFLAEKYNFTDEDLFPRVKQKVYPFIKNYVRSTMTGYSSITTKDEKLNIDKRNGIYVLFPVWMIVYDLNKQEHTFAMNGQTGKVVGKPPISKRKVLAWLTSLSASLFVVLKIVAGLIGGVWF